MLSKFLNKLATFFIQVKYQNYVKFEETLCPQINSYAALTLYLLMGQEV
jgi:hypothetical protein